MFCRQLRHKSLNYCIIYISGYLTIGIPVVGRPDVGIDYFKLTMSSVTQEMTSTNTTILVFMSESNHTVQQEIQEFLRTRYQGYIDDGRLHICVVDSRAYQEIKSVHAKTNDNVQRIKWRSKQTLDYAVMFQIASKYSQYYMQLEDDVICEKGIMNDIRMFIDAQENDEWTLLEFTQQGFIGKLLKSEDLPYFARYFWMFYQQVPVDWLLLRYRGIFKHRRIFQGRTLFHHIGLISSLDGQRRKDAYIVAKPPLYSQS